MTINIAERLKTIRKANGLTMLQVSTYLGKKDKAYQAYEEGRAEPSLYTFIKLKDLYGFQSIDDLLIAKESKKKRSALEDAYLKASAEKRRIVDFVLGV